MARGGILEYPYMPWLLGHPVLADPQPEDDSNHYYGAPAPFSIADTYTRRPFAR